MSAGFEGDSREAGGATAEGAGMRRWSELDADEQLRLREEYGHYLDSLPPTCSLETKMERFRGWLQSRSVELDKL